MKNEKKAILVELRKHQNFSKDNPTIAAYFVPQMDNINEKFAKIANRSYTTSVNRYVMTFEIDTTEYTPNEAGFDRFCKDYPLNEIWEGLNLFAFSVKELTENKYESFHTETHPDREAFSRYIASFDDNESMLFQRESRRLLRQISKNQIIAQLAKEEGEEE